MKCLFVIILILCCFGCSSETKKLGKSWLTMGTFATVTVSEKYADKLDECVLSSKNIFTKVDNIMSVFKDDSEISMLNKSAGKKTVHISPWTKEVIEMSLKYADMTGRCFDPTVAPLVRLWGFNGGTIPDKPLKKTLVASVLSNTGYKHLLLSGGMAYLDKPGLGIDLGGIAKGYAVDLAYKSIAIMNIDDIIINLGGNIRCKGGSDGRGFWRIGVRNPFKKDDLIGVLKLTGGMAVATSGNYERFVNISGKRYAHIIDPRTGYPVEGMAGVTVISTSAVEADALSTALFVMGVNQVEKFSKYFNNSCIMLIPDTKPVTIWISSGFKKYFTPYPDFLKNINIFSEEENHAL